MKVRIARDSEIQVKYHQSAAFDTLLQKKVMNKDEELQDAVQWCKDRNCRGHKALNAVNENGEKLFTRIKDARTITRYLDNKLKIGAEKQYCRILTVHEEECLVRYIKNKNRSLQSLTESAVSEVVLAILPRPQEIEQIRW